MLPSAKTYSTGTNFQIAKEKAANKSASKSAQRGNGEKYFRTALRFTCNPPTD